ncbi:MAG: hypothetical protein COA97_12240 [Flavobacteriales bacterium]|nr:MAG: hypothetical protein COA97_12240 [Flavobacteriales bacterium]
MKKLLIIIFLFSVLCSFGQEEKKYDKIISFTELITEIENAKPGFVTEFRNTHIKLDARNEYNSENSW